MMPWLQELDSTASLSHNNTVSLLRGALKGGVSYAEQNSPINTNRNKCNVFQYN